MSQLPRRIACPHPRIRTEEADAHQVHAAQAQLAKRLVAEQVGIYRTGHHAGKAQALGQHRHAEGVDFELRADADNAGRVRRRKVCVLVLQFVNESAHAFDEPVAQPRIGPTLVIHRRKAQRR